MRAQFSVQGISLDDLWNVTKIISISLIKVFKFYGQRNRNIHHYISTDTYSCPISHVRKTNFILNELHVHDTSGIWISPLGLLTRGREKSLCKILISKIRVLLLILQKFELLTSSTTYVSNEINTLASYTHWCIFIFEQYLETKLRYQSLDLYKMYIQWIVYVVCMFNFK